MQIYFSTKAHHGIGLSKDRTVRLEKYCNIQVFRAAINQFLAFICLDNSRELYNSKMSSMTSETRTNKCHFGFDNITQITPRRIYREVSRLIWFSCFGFEAPAIPESASPIMIFPTYLYIRGASLWAGNFGYFMCHTKRYISKCTREFPLHRHVINVSEHTALPSCWFAIYLFIRT